VTSAQRVANELAVRYEVARDFGRAADCFRLAAQNTGQVFASQEALALAQRALAMTERLPDLVSVANGSWRYRSSWVMD
jgi:hypothetical protein